MCWDVFSHLQGWVFVYLKNTKNEHVPNFGKAQGASGGSPPDTPDSYRSLSFMNQQTYLLIGHVTQDLQPDGSYITGGTVTYASAVVQQLGWKPVVITTAAPDFTPPAYLAGTEWIIGASNATTTFHNQYTPHGRRQIVGPIARNITPADVPLRYRNAPVVHLCPLTQELDVSMTQVFAPESYLMTTPQGWLRQWDADGVVSLTPWPGHEKILPELDLGIISIEDVEGQWDIAESWANRTSLFIVTEEALGCTVFYNGKRFRVPPRPSQPVDPTGAGDVFAAAFLIRYHETGRFWDAAYFANVTASMAIERPGPVGVPSRAEIDAYMTQNPVEVTSL